MNTTNRPAPAVHNSGARLHPSSLAVPPPLAAAIRALARDHRSGSLRLAWRACGVLAQCKPAAAQRRDDLFRELALAVAQAQPSMAAVWNVCNCWLGYVQQGRTPHQAARRVEGELAQALSAVAAAGSKLLRGGNTVATYSASSTVMAALLAARRSGCRFGVICSEARPMLEGRSLALRLAARGVRVEFSTDAALLASLRGCDLVLLGCDAILPGYFVNKVGTHALVRMARLRHIPVYLLADTFKFLPRAATRSFSIREETPDEVWSQSRKNLTVRNFYFELIPLRLCSGILTERGIWSAAQVAAYWRGRKASLSLEPGLNQGRGLALARR